MGVGGKERPAMASEWKGALGESRRVPRCHRRCSSPPSFFPFRFNPEGVSSGYPSLHNCQCSRHKLEPAIVLSSRSCVEDTVDSDVTDGIDPLLRSMHGGRSVTNGRATSTARLVKDTKGGTTEENVVRDEEGDAVASF